MSEDNQWTMARVIRPFANFERRYQGVSGTIPIAFPGTIDALASQGLPGFNPDLLSGISVPLGSQLRLWIPQTLTSEADDPEEPAEVNALYQYQILWRLRTPRDFTAGQQPATAHSTVQNYSSYHLPASPLGIQNVNAERRFYLPGAMQTMAYVQEEPDTSTPGVVQLRGQYLRPMSTNPLWVQPLTPAGRSGIWQQGVLDSESVNTGGPEYLTYTTRCEGDELMILAYKIDTTDPWDFTVDAPGDGAFSNTFGTAGGTQSPPNDLSGILITTGS